MLGGKSPVVADDDLLAPFAVGCQVDRKALGAASHVVEGVILGDSAAPAVGAEFDDSHGCLPRL
jgi:hypothetical protein